SRLAGHDTETARAALGLTYCQISGNMQAHVEGTPGLALQIGFNARAAVNAAELAAAGMRGPEDVIDGPFGYLDLIEQQYRSDPLQWLGSSFQIEQVSHKPFPTGRAAHAALDGLEQLLAAGLDADAIDRIELHAPPLIRRLVGRPPRPGMSASYARLCLPWLVSVRLARGELGLDDFSEQALADPKRWRHTEQIKVLPDDNDDPNALTPQRLSVVTNGGARHEIALTAVLGSPQRRLDKAARERKARGCWQAAGWDDERGEALLELLRASSSLPRLDPLFELLTPP
ncbi:MAG: MmgE/PrpD family protein, partial [Wenzhouxiangella sp.]